ncbi:MAG: magnesium transporter [candidate division FCPU426 bacterium]
MADSIDTSANTELVASVTRQLRNGEEAAVSAAVSALHPVDAARLVARLEEADRLALLEILNRETAADIVEQLTERDKARVVGALEPEVASGIVREMASDEAADVLGDLPQAKTDAILATWSPRQAAKARRLIAFAEDSAGGLMATEFVALRESLTVRQALRSLRTQLRRLKEGSAAYVYTVDRTGALTGVLQLRDLVTRRPEQPLADLKLSQVQFVHHSASKEEVARRFHRHRYLALPVVDDQQRLLGVITADSLVDLTREIATEEMLKMQGLDTDETRALPVLKIVRRRITWLSLNIVLNLIAASVIAFYTDTLKAVIALAVFLPIISDMSGVSGMQAVAVSIRDLALNRTSPQELWRVIGKEARIGFINGLVLGAEIGLVSYLWKGLPWLGVVVAVSLWLNTIISVCMGSGLPLLIKRFNLDPAIASGPILTTITDLMGFLIVLSLATRLLPHLI